MVSAVTGYVTLGDVSSNSSRNGVATSEKLPSVSTSLNKNKKHFQDATYRVKVDISEQSLNESSNVNFELVETKDVGNFTIKAQILEPMWKFFL